MFSVANAMHTDTLGILHILCSQHNLTAQQNNW